MDEFESQEELFFGDLLKQFRQRKKLTQQQLAEKIEVTRETVSLWERGNYKPEAKGILYQIVNVLGLTNQEQGQLFEAYTVTALSTSFHHPPSKRNPYFTGRGAQLKQLHSLLSAGKQVALTQAISGLGGIGKTQLALEYAYRYQKSYHDIFWASADTEEALMASYVRFVGMLYLPEAEEADQNKVKEAVRRWFQQHTNWLLVLDNIEDLHLLPSFVPENRQGAVLLTTRRQVTEPVAQALELEVLPDEDAILFLLKRTKVLALDASLEDASADEIEAARVITRLLDNLPLALDQAGAYILETKCGFAKYAMLFQTHRDHLLQRRIGENIPTDHPDSVTTTFWLNFEQVQQRSVAAADLLRLCAYLAPDTIAEEVLTEGAALLGPVLSPVAADAFLFNRVVESLQTYSLVRRDSREKTLSVHRLVQAVLQDHLLEAERRTWAERAILAINIVFPDVEPDTWSRCERLLPQALQVAQLVEDFQIIRSEAGRLLYQSASYLKDRARYQEAELLFQQALHVQNQALGPEHLDVALSLNGLAILYGDLGRYTEAEPLYQRALHIRLHLLGPEHDRVATIFNNLATLYYKQGKYTEAEPLYQRALSIWKQQLGPEHPNIANALYNLGNLYREQGKYEKAEPFYQRALDIKEKQLGPKHLDVASSLNGLAIFYDGLGKYEKAELLYQRALDIWEQQLGPEHPQAVYPLNGLAILYYNQGKYAEAEPLFQRVLDIWEQQLGPEHPQVAALLNNLATLYHEQGKYTEAVPLAQRAFSIWERRLEPEHPNIASALYNLANLYREQGKYVEAEPLYQRALDIREHQLGPEHSETAEIIHDLARLREAQGNHEEAESLYRRALAICEQTLGVHHRKTIETHTRLNTLLHAAGEA